jgi:hypothetical protein
MRTLAHIAHNFITEIKSMISPFWTKDCQPTTSLSTSTMTRKKNNNKQTITNMNFFLITLTQMVKKNTQAVNSIADHHGTITTL